MNSRIDRAPSGSRQSLLVNHGVIEVNIVTTASLEEPQRKAEGGINRKERKEGEEPRIVINGTNGDGRQKNGAEGREVSV